MSDSNLKPINIKIKSFQSIEELEFEIYGFTCITGSSNIGKTAIIRAISSSLKNSSVVGMVRSDEKFCSVEFKTDGLEFVWEKGDKYSGTYNLNGKKYEKIGQAQLQELKDFGYGSVKVGSKDVYPWHASQFDPIFLLNDSGPAVTEFISDISRLNVLQDAITISLRRKKKNLDKVKLKQEDLNNLKSKLDGLSSLDEVGQIYDELLEQAESIKLYENRILDGEKYYEQINSKANLIIKLKQYDNEIPSSDEISNKFFELKELVKYWAALESKAKHVLSIIDGSNISISDPPIAEFNIYSKLNKLKSTESLKTIISKLESAKSIKLPNINFDISNIKRGSMLNSSITDIKTIVDNLTNELKVISSQEDDLNNQLELIPKCPTCNRPVGHTEVHAA